MNVPSSLDILIIHIAVYSAPLSLQLTKSPECSDCKVFATDTILSTLMTCARSNYSWDIVVQVYIHWRKYTADNYV